MKIQITKDHLNEQQQEDEAKFQQKETAHHDCGGLWQTDHLSVQQLAAIGQPAIHKENCTQKFTLKRLQKVYKPDSKSLQHCTARTSFNFLALYMLRPFVNHESFSFNHICCWL